MTSDEIRAYLEAHYPQDPINADAPSQLISMHGIYYLDEVTGYRGLYVDAAGDVRRATLEPDVTIERLVWMMSAGHY